jgi:putative FmdB family regulatory protein
VPLYSYHCPTCDHREEKLVRKMDEEQRCPKCGLILKQVWSTPAPAQWRCSKGSL